ncbi:hypothetical protein [Azospirillum sp. ST 5-10]|uniref:hypothetical protein n=1 Tax=unclassified Azospirillum TaxID=2630922 RepID=UPI003F4A61B2
MRTHLPSPVTGTRRWSWVEAMLGGRPDVHAAAAGAGDRHGTGEDDDDAAMRLWLSWLRPVIVVNAAALGPDLHLPGLLHAVDAAAWWVALSRRVPDLRPSPGGGTAGGGGPVDPAAWAEFLRRESLRVLTAAERCPGSRERLLAEVNRERGRLTGGRRLAPLGAADLRALTALLGAAPLWRSLGGPAGQVASAELLAFLEAALASGQADTDGIMLLGLAHLHARPDPSFAEALHGLHPSPLVEMACLAHLSLAMGRLRDAIDQRLLGVRVCADAAPSRDPTDLLAEGLAWYDRLKALAFFRSREVADEAEGLLAAVAAKVERRLEPALLQQLERTTVTDLPIRLPKGIRFTQGFAAEMARRHRAWPRSVWRSNVGAELLRLYREALRLPPAASLDPLSELAELADSVERPIPVSVLDDRLLAAVEHALRRGAPLSEAERRLVRRTIQAGAEERRRLRWWMPDGVRRLLDAAAQAGSGDPPLHACR